MDEEEIKMDGGVARYFICFGGNCFIELWEAQPCLWDPE